MQQSIGVARALVDERPDFRFLPMVRSLPRVKDETTATVCPIVQASPDIFRADLGDGVATRIVRPVIDIGPGNLASAHFRRSIACLARELEIPLPIWVSAYREARAAQEAFDVACNAIGERALTFCRDHAVTPVIILGRAYTIHNTVLNSNVPAIVREQGALPIPVDCYPADDETPSFDRVYWGYAQRSLRAAHQIRRRRREYSVYCSNYSCGPDSFNLHFFADAMAGKPFAVIETDGHSGDAGTKTRIEAFLHCVREDERAMGSVRARTNDFTRIDRSEVEMADIKRQREVLLIPRMGSNAEVLAAAYRGAGFRAEALALPDHAALELGRRHTSGKECLPMTITAGSLLARLERERDPATRFAFFMPTANGPCRFGAYNLLHKLIIERSGWSDRVRVFSPADDDYFKEVDGGFQALIWAGFVAEDLLLDAYHHARPAEVSRGAAKRVHDAFAARLRVLVENEGHGNLKIPRAIKEIATGRLFGVATLIAEAAAAFARTYDSSRALPTVQVVGEIYVRCDPFANGFVVEKLLERGVRVRFAPFSEWIEYTRWVGHKKRRAGISRDKRPAPIAHLTSALESRVKSTLYAAMARPLGWPARTHVDEMVLAASPYLRDELDGEAILTLGGPIHEHRAGLIDGVVSVGPLDCMPNKIAEALFFHVGEREKLLSLTIPLNGEPFDITLLDDFVFELCRRFDTRGRSAVPARTHRGAHARA
jgi:predicted nucleotide-binding protein (sugar kinase/HSP70/actin superfamily)